MPCEVLGGIFWGYSVEKMYSEINMYPKYAQKNHHRIYHLSYLEDLSSLAEILKQSHY